MNQEWSEKNKRMQSLLNKEATFHEAITVLIELRQDVFNQITQIMVGYPEEAFYQIPFAGVNGYHSKTLSYSIWHIFRIEDIVAHEMIAEDEQILFRNGYPEKIHAPIITTGNELAGLEIAGFSKQLDRWHLYQYAKDVLESTNQLLLSLEYKDLKRKFGDDIVNCEKGFYVPGNDGAGAAKAQALYVKKYGKKEFLKLQDRLHEKFIFSKTQEILGQDIWEGLRILEGT